MSYYNDDFDDHEHDHRPADGDSDNAPLWVAIIWVAVILIVFGAAAGA